MTQNYWLAIARSKSLSEVELKETWWCLPMRAQKEDLVILYCPRSISSSRHGVFAEAKVLYSPNSNSEDNNRCSIYGIGDNKSLLYTEIVILQRFKNKLTAKHMKANPILENANFVRRNFQGTTFSVDPQHYRVVKDLLKTLNPNETS